MKPHQILGKYFEVYGQLSPKTPEAGKKGLLFQKFEIFMLLVWSIRANFLSKGFSKTRMRFRGFALSPFMHQYMQKGGTQVMEKFLVLCGKGPMPILYINSQHTCQIVVKKNVSYKK